MNPPKNATEAEARARLDYGAARDEYQRFGISEHDFVRAELHRQGFSAPPPVAPPNWLASGLAMQPTGNEMSRK